AILCVLVSSSLPKLRGWFARRALIRRYGCKDPPLIQGLDLGNMNGKATQEHKYLETTARLFEKYGKTHKVRSFGRTVVRTSDPEVSKTVFSTQFEKFGLQ